MDKPENWGKLSNTQKLDCIAEVIYNCIPTQIKWLNTKLTFILAFLAIVMGLSGAAIALMMQHLIN